MVYIEKGKAKGMKRVTAFFANIKQGLSQLVFPSVCLCCGVEPLNNNQHVCSFCLHKRFEDANAANNPSASGVLLPDKVKVQHALWSFDKGGDLQNLMHHLKYERLISVGSQLGRAVARRSRSHPVIQSILGDASPVLVPVPLHYLKFKKRGFNQAFHIARGIEEVLDIPICGVDAVIRNRFTRSQTGFTLHERIKNMDDAFKVKHPKAVRNKIIIIVDDVFTTGATSFELAKTVNEAGAESIMIWTIAQA